MNPEEVIRRKRAIDRSIQVNRYLFRSDFWDAYQALRAGAFRNVLGRRPAGAAAP